VTTVISNDQVVISIRDLVKTYGAVRALDGLTLEIPSGSVGLLGPNGAGKTTLIKLLRGLLRADSGRASIVGRDPTRRRERLEIRRSVGYMPEGDCLLPGMTSVGLTMTLGRIAGLTWEDAMTRAHEVLDYVGLFEARYRELTQYSTGMKQRLKLAQALVHDPPLLLLDEPTNGLDPKGRRHMLELVDDLGRQQGKNVLLCSHLLQDVEKTCDHIVVLHRGRSVAAGSIEEMTRGDGATLRVRVEEASDAFAQALGEKGHEFEREEAGLFRITGASSGAGTDSGPEADEFFDLARSAGGVITSVESVRSTLDEVFVKVLRESQSD
jgi:ABC-2 type transport system ATP-binding protein